MRKFPQLFGLALASFVLFAACGGDSDDATRTYELGLTTNDSTQEYEYVASEPFDIRVGDEVTIEMLNTGALIHDLQIVDPDGKAIATAPAVAPGATLTLTATFDISGIYQLNCLVDNHLTQHGMQALIQVTEPDA